MNDYSTQSLTQSFITFSCEFGYSELMLLDEGSQLVKGCKTMQLCFKDIKGNLHKDMMVESDICSIRRNIFDGKVERKIRQIKVAEISNAINDLPLAMGNLVSDFENMDLITPNRLRLGRSNDRSPVSPMKVTRNYQKMLEENKKIYNIWFEAWLASHVPKLMDQPK